MTNYTAFQLEGEAVMEQGESQAVLSRGDITLIDASRPSCFTYNPRGEAGFAVVAPPSAGAAPASGRNPLRPEWIAAESGMSVRSLYRLFADKGLVVAQYIKNRRLDLCAQALRTASHSEKLAGIGYNWGFADHSHFSTAFKGRFGVSPGEYRKRFSSTLCR